jgi:hypothetical protein
MTFISETVCFLNSSSVLKTWSSLLRVVIVLDLERFVAGPRGVLPEGDVAEEALVRGYPFPTVEDID